MKTHAGADISARWFDICVVYSDQAIHQRFDNNRPGLRSCIKWLESLGIKNLDIAIEPTGRYGELVAEYFFRRKHRVLLAQPFMFHRYAESLDMRGKSDYKDALALAKYCKERGDTLREWKPKSEMEWELRDIQVLIRGLTKRATALQCQLKCHLRSKFVEQALNEELKRCQKQLDQALEHAKDVVLGDPILSVDFQLLCTIPGIAEKSALLMLTLIDFRKFRSSRKLACFLGLTKKKYESGETVRGAERISKRGSKIVRNALFMPARTARIHNPAIREFSERMEANGKHDWAIQMAVIRRLVTTAWSLIVNQVEFDREFVNQYKLSPT
jgi:transposase